MPRIDIAQVEFIIAEVAATEIMPRFRCLEKHEIETKHDKTVVTIADREAEKALTSRLRDMLPGSVVVGEENCEQNPEILSRFSADHDVWVIDPIDGTRNFVEGRSEFGVMVALLRRRQTIAAWIHDPTTRDTLTAEQGGGVWLRGKKMRLAGEDPAFPRRMLIGSRLKSNLSKPEFASLKAIVPDLDVGSAAAFDYARLFTGDAVFAGDPKPRATFLLYRRAKAWDHIPGLFLHAEAGGYAANFFGKPYDMQGGDEGLLVAPDQAEWQRLFDSFKPALESLQVS